MGKKILLIDDEPDWLMVLEHCLKAKNYEVIKALNGEEGLKLAIAGKPDLIILDVLMPAMSGYEFVQALRNLDSDVKEIPIIVMSVRKSMKEFFNEWEIDSFVSKTSDPQALIAAAEEVLERKTADGMAGGGSSQPVIKTSVRKAMLIGADESILSQTKAFLEKQNIRVFVHRSENEVLKTADYEKPDVVFCQFAKDSQKINAYSIYNAIKHHSGTNWIPFIPYCVDSLIEQALVTFGAWDKKAVVLGYQDVKGLLQKIEDYLKSR